MTHASLALTIPLAAVLLALAVPAGIVAQRGWTGRLERRGRLGLHTPAALASDEAFALANRVIAPIAASAAVVGIVCAVLVLLLPIGAAGAVIVFAVGLAGVLGQLFASSHLGERAARTVPVPARKPAGGCCGGADGAGGCGCGGEAGSASCAAAADAIPDLVPDVAPH